MKSLLPIVFVSAVVSALVSLLAAGLRGSAATSTTPAVPRVDRAGAAASGGQEDHTDVRMAVARLEDEIEALQMRVAQLSAAPREGRRPAIVDDPPADLAATLSNLDPAGERVFFDEVSRVVAKLEEDKEAAEWERELEERRVEADASYEEYDAVDANLAASVSRLSVDLQLGSADAGELSSLLALQNDRNRQMTQLWSAGETSDEELGEIFLANRAKHRAEIRALVGESGLAAYKRFVQDGGLGGRFAYFTAPWETWAEEDPAR
ncbi:MAG: hypothetical protein AAF726_21620 [Planctomycetota bacterium]